MIYTGQQWPPDRDRIDDYRRYLCLYDGDHRAAFIQSIAAKIYGGDDLTFFALDYPRTIVDIPADLLVGAPPVISFEDPELNDSWQGIQKRSRFDSVLLEAAQDSGKFGDALFLARDSSSRGGIVIEAKPAYCYFPTLDPDNIREVIGEALAWKRSFEDCEIIRVDRYEPGQIVREAWTLDGIKVGRRMIGAQLMRALGDAPEVERVGPRDRNVLVHLPNTRGSSEYFGRSDLGGGLPTLFEEVDERLSQIARILDKHASPKMAGPHLAVGPDGVYNQALGDYFGLSNGQDAPSYITWDAQLIAAFEAYKAVKDEIFRHSQISPILAGYVNGASYDSARAFKLQLAPTLLKMARKALYLDAATSEIVRIAVAMDLGQTYAETPPPNIRWRDGLPKDLSEMATTNATRIANGTISRHTAIMAELDCDEATAQAEIDKVLGEQQDFGGASMPETPAEINTIDATPVADMSGVSA